MRRPLNIFSTTYGTQKNPFWPQKLENDPTSGLKSKVRIKRNIENNSYSTILIDLITIVKLCLPVRLSVGKKICFLMIKEVCLYERSQTMYEGLNMIF